MARAARWCPAQGPVSRACGGRETRARGRNAGGWEQVTKSKESAQPCRHKHRKVRKLLHTVTRSILHVHDTKQNPGKYHF